MPTGPGGSGDGGAFGSAGLSSNMAATKNHCRYSVGGFISAVPFTSAITGIAPTRTAAAAIVQAEILRIRFPPLVARGMTRLRLAVAVTGSADRTASAR